MFATLIKSYRERAALSQVELARRAHTTQATISRLEAGEYVPSAPVAARLIQVLGIPTADALAALASEFQPAPSAA